MLNLAILAITVIACELLAICAILDRINKAIATLATGPKMVVCGACERAFVSELLAGAGHKPDTEVYQ